MHDLTASELILELQAHIRLEQQVIARTEFHDPKMILHPVNGLVPVAEVEEILGLIQETLDHVKERID